MKDKHLHIVALNIPYPANYGGAIDIFYKIKALHDLGIQIHLHCFQYGRQQSETLNNLCNSVQYYPRKMHWKHLFSKTPFIVKSRASKRLLVNLQKHKAPILFEGLHTCYFLNHPDLKDQPQFVRSHNIERNYYKALAKSENKAINKLYLFAEHLKIKNYEARLSDADGIFSISLNDHHYFNKIGQSHYIKAFHPSNNITCKKDKGTYALYHGNLSVSENQEAVIFLIQNVFNKIDYPLIITGYSPSKNLRQLIKNYNNVNLIENPEERHLEEMLQNAQMHVLPTFQDTGIKLKLLKSLYSGRHCIVNGKMANNTGLETLCHIIEKPDEWIAKINQLKELPFESSEIRKRQNILVEFNCIKEAKKITQLIFPQGV